jgi:hypothetical protein
MGNGWLVAGIFTTIFSIIFKIILNKPQNEGRKVLWYLHLTIQKGNPSSALSFVQLLGLIWIVEGVLINLIGDGIKIIPGPLVFACECFIPLLILYLITKLLFR